MKERETGERIAVEEKLNRRLIIQNNSELSMIKVTHWIEQLLVKVKNSLIPSGSGIVTLAVREHEPHDVIKLVSVENKASVRVIFTTIKYGDQNDQG